MLFKTKLTTFQISINSHSYPCPICGKAIKPGDNYTFIDPDTENGKQTGAYTCTNEECIQQTGAYTCTNEECIQMRIFQMME